MLAYLGVSSAWQRRTFWTAENLMASTFYGNSAIRSGFSEATASGIALYLVSYSLIGALFALALGARQRTLRFRLIAMAFGLAWYYVSVNLVWRIWSPLVPLLHAERPTVLGHLLFGVLLARYPLYLPQAAPPTVEVAADASVDDRPAEQPSTLEQ